MPTFTTLENFGHSLRAQSHVIQPRSADEIHETFQLAKKEGLTVTARGAGRSYNDAAMNGGGIVLDLSAMNQILAWDPATGAMRAGSHAPAVVAKNPAGWLVAARCLGDDDHHAGRLSRREHPRQE
jgi:hypothetical protein